MTPITSITPDMLAHESLDVLIRWARTSAHDEDLRAAEAVLSDTRSEFTIRARVLRAVADELATSQASLDSVVVVAGEV